MFNGPHPLDDEYVRKHARAGEDWQPARTRLDGEVQARYCGLPTCEVCASESESMGAAGERHRLGLCVMALDAWPAAALSPRLFEAAHVQSAAQVKAMAALARAQIELRLAAVSQQSHPINALNGAYSVEGFLQACRALDLFGNDEWLDLLEEVSAVREQAREAFIQQYQARDPQAVPWRAALPIKEEAGHE